MSEHTIKAFDTELHDLAQAILEMGRLVEKQIGDAIGVLSNHDLAVAQEIIAADAKIDRMQREIVGVLRIANGLERIGDYAKNIGKRAIATGTEIGPATAVHGLQRMANLVLAALKQVLDAYARRDLPQALAVWRGDEAIDAANNSLFRELLTYMMEDPRNIRPCTHLLFCAKNIERMGDHATNIAETIYYIMKGVPIEEERPKGDAINLNAVPHPNR